MLEPPLLQRSVYRSRHYCFTSLVLILRSSRPEVFHRKSCSEKCHQIYRKIPATVNFVSKLTEQLFHRTSNNGCLLLLQRKMIASISWKSIAIHWQNAWTPKKLMSVVVSKVIMEMERFVEVRLAVSPVGNIFE